MIELNLRHTLLLLVLGLAGCGDRETDPFGKLSKEELTKWESDCPEQVTDKPASGDKQDPDAVTVGDRLAFGSATHRLRCAPAGWTLWLDANERIAGLCTESYVDISVTPSQIATAVERGEPVLRRHFPATVVDEMVQGFCLEHPRQISRRLLRWEIRLPKSTPNSHFACCWEVTR
jgi:hypothetical protein